MKRESSAKRFVKSKMFSLLVFLLLLIVVFTVITKGQFTARSNIRTIFQMTSVIGLLAVGAGALMISGHIDLSVGGNGTLCALMCAVLAQSGVPWWICILIAIATGIIVGIFNAFLINRLNFQPFIATLAVAQITEGLAYLVSNSRPISIVNPALKFIGGGRLTKDIPYSVLIIVVAFVIYAVLLSKTRFGRSVYLIGSNPEASRLSGLRPKKLLYILFANSGALAAISGIILMTRVGSANATGITTNQFSGITASVLGGISFGGGSGGMAGAFIGLLILSSFNNAMTLIGMDAYLQTTAAGALLIVALIVDYFSMHRGAGRVKRKKEVHENEA